MASPPRVGISLCAGGGGLDMGLGLAEPGFTTACFVEIEEYPRAVIAAAQAAGYFLAAPIWDDLKRFSGRPWNGIADTLLAGYPCQPFSHAGQRKGTSDPRHLWPCIARIISECDSLEWLFFENVSGHVTLGLEQVLRDIRGLGFKAAAGLFTAAETGAAHERLRLFIVAHRDSHNRCADSGQSVAGTDGRHILSGRSQNVDNPASPRCQAARQPEPAQPARGQRVSGDGRSTVADTSGTKLEGQQPGQRDPRRWRQPDEYPALPGGTGIHSPGPADFDAWRGTIVTQERLDLLPAASLDDAILWADNHAAALGHPGQAAAEPAVRRMADGLAYRSRALRLLGNGVFPLVAGHAWRTLAAAHGLRPVDFDRGSAEAAARAEEFV